MYVLLDGVMLLFYIETKDKSTKSLTLERENRSCYELKAVAGRRLATVTVPKLTPRNAKHVHET